MIFRCDYKGINKMSNFPLYEQLSQDISSKDLTVKQKTTLVKQITNLDGPGKDLVFVLIQTHLKNTNEEYNIFPYECTAEISEVDPSMQNLTWSLNNLPIKLRHILWKFSVLHFQNMEEEEKRMELSTQ